ncbi:MAG: LPS core biosynthesis protein [Bradyrhizobiaceae bacterium]|nr:MAG: LPS core biosynthesis protein [Bradyrhizobiaceae bacterium]
MQRIVLPPRSRILVVALRRLGDVLLTTPLIRSLKRAFPDAAVDALVFAGTEGILAGNPDLAGVVTMPAHPGAGESLALARRLWRRYDLAVSTQSGDRPTWFAWVAGRVSAGPVEGRRLGARLKALALDRAVAADGNRHRVAEVLALAEALGVAPVGEVVAPSGSLRAELRPGRRYAVVHAEPMFRYKRWTEAGWRALAAALAARGLAVVATGAPSDRERLDGLWHDTEVMRRDGALTWGELATLIREAAVYVGPDTSVTHLAAATGAPTVALYGPTDPRLWGPWPERGLDAPWAAAGTIQRRGNAWLVQNPLPCLPCQQEGCLRRIDSHSQCLDELSVEQVLRAVDQALAGEGAGLAPASPS